MNVTFFDMFLGKVVFLVPRYWLVHERRLSHDNKYQTEQTCWDVKSQIYILMRFMKAEFEDGPMLPVTALRRISGATYSGVPQMLLVLCFTYLDRPKSTILMWPLESRRIFSGLRSLEWLAFSHANVKDNWPVHDVETVKVWKSWHHLCCEELSNRNTESGQSFKGIS